MKVVINRANSYMTYNATRIFYKSNVDIFGIRLTIPNKPGTLRKVLDTISKRGINIGFIHGEEKDHYGEVFLVGYQHDREMLPELLRDLNSIVTKYEVIDSTKRGLVIDDRTIPVTYMNKRLVAASIDLWHGLIRGVKEYLPESAYQAYLWHIGKSMGMAAVKLHKNLRSSQPPEVIVDHLRFGISMGWFISAEMEHYHNNEKIIIRVYGLWECKGISTGAANSHLYRGFLAGLLSGLYNKEYIAIEERCLSRGDDCCEFLLSSRAK